MKWNGKLGYWEEDEWLTGLYAEMWLARREVEQWGEGRRWDNSRELQITRYFGKRKTEFTRGMEKAEGDPAVCEKQWLRYEEYVVKERSEKDCLYL